MLVFGSACTITADCSEMASNIRRGLVPELPEDEDKATASSPCHTWLPCILLCNYVKADRANCEAGQWSGPCCGI